MKENVFWLISSMAKKTDKIFSIDSNEKKLNKKCVVEFFCVCQFISVFESAYIIFKIGNLNRFHFRFFFWIMTQFD